MQPYISSEGGGVVYVSARAALCHKGPVALAGGGAGSELRGPGALRGGFAPGLAGLPRRPRKGRAGPPECNGWRAARLTGLLSPSGPEDAPRGAGGTSSLQPLMQYLPPQQAGGSVFACGLPLRGPGGEGQATDGGGCPRRLPAGARWAALGEPLLRAETTGAAPRSAVPAGAALGAATLRHVGHSVWPEGWRVPGVATGARALPAAVCTARTGYYAQSVA